MNGQRNMHKSRKISISEQQIYAKGAFYAGIALFLNK